MTKEEIIRLMHEAVKDHSEYYAGCGDPKGEDLEVFVKFAELVAQREREACAKVCDERHYAWRFGEGEDSTSGPKECAAIIRERCNDPHPPI